MTSAEVVVVGGGPAGLAAAAMLARRGAGRVVVLEREAEPGGIPRHANHQGFGARDLRRLLSGPEYAARNVEAAVAAGADVWTEAQATGWSASDGLEVTSPTGRVELRASAVVLATGCRERPRAARLVPGARPQRGVMTTGTLQQRAAAGERFDGARAVVVGCDHVSASAVATLAHAGARVVTMVAERTAAEALAAYRALTLARHRVPLRARTVLAAIHGGDTVEAVALRGADGVERLVGCEVVVLTADWTPDHELAALAGAALDHATRGPRITPEHLTSRPGLFAVGNVVRGAEPADRVALEGRRAAAAVERFLAGAPWPAQRVPLACTRPLRWIAPSALAASPGERGGRFALLSEMPLLAPTIAVTQGERELWRGRLLRVLPDRPVRLPAQWARRVDPGGEPLAVRVAQR